MNAPVQIANRLTHSPLNRLERAGWAVVAGEAMRLNCGDAAILRELVLDAGRFVGVDRLAGVSGRRSSDPNQLSHPRFRIAVRIARIRNALDDCGIPRAAIRNDTEAGYFLSPAHAARVREMVEGRA